MGEEQKKKFVEYVTGPNNHLWKGDNASYGAIHIFVRRRLPKPDLCEFCNVRKSRDLANITGIYNRELINWKYLCRMCHVRYDDNARKGWLKRKKDNVTTL